MVEPVARRVASKVASRLAFSIASPTLRYFSQNRAGESMRVAR